MDKTPSQGTALVTGASKRIGKALCLSLAAAGYHIAVHYHHSRDEAENLVHLIRKMGKKAEGFQCNLLNVHEANLLIRQAYKKFPDLNVLINNASLFEKSRLIEGDVDHLEKNLMLHLKTPFILMKDFALNCKKGNIINILDAHIVKNNTSHFSYLLSKKALAHLTQLAAVELAPSIRVNAVAPGLILPPDGENDEYLNRLAKNIPLKKKGDVHQITQCVKFILENTYLTGQIIYNDGGEHLL